ncbi:hypothetical protein NQ318_000664 [Aromia moschata]|uniref:Secreted protein n=1 Tax=Aromia moschata TaxID=1265417 RepID=A0AAV8Y232_9CUCU|nr:hypothetical protein NQ318_000664 [Aromia moschata]
MCPKRNKLFCFICLVMGGNQSAWTQEECVGKGIRPVLLTSRHRPSEASQPFPIQVATLHTPLAPSQDTSISVGPRSLFLFGGQVDAKEAHRDHGHQPQVRRPGRIVDPRLNDRGKIRSETQSVFGGHARRLYQRLLSLG